MYPVWGPRDRAAVGQTAFGISPSARVCRLASIKDFRDRHHVDGGLQLTMFWGLSEKTLVRPVLFPWLSWASTFRVGTARLPVSGTSGVPRVPVGQLGELFQIQRVIDRAALEVMRVILRVVSTVSATFTRKIFDGFNPAGDCATL